jgi:general secretion pathway protein J
MGSRPVASLNNSSRFLLPDHRGFTLLEMLLAIVIFSLVIGVIFTSFRLGSSSWEKGERDIERYQKIRAINELIYREVRSCFPYILTPGELDTHVKFYAFFGKTDSLKFVSAASVQKINRGLSFIEFWVKEGTGLMVGEVLALGPELADVSLRDEDRALLIDPDVKNIQFRYFDKTSKDEKGEWEQTWDPRNKTGRDLRMPEAVQVSLEFDMGNGRVFNQEFIVPIGTDLYSTLYNYGT